MFVSKKKYLKDIAECETEIFEVTRERDRLRKVFDILTKKVKLWKQRKIGNTRLCNYAKNLTEQL